jgi:hypothetical protein
MAKAAATSRVLVPEVKMAIIEIPIRGIDGPLVVHNWSEKAIAEMLAKQMGNKVKTKEAKNPEADYRSCLYVATDGTYGFPAPAFKSAMVSAARGVDGLKMTELKQRIFILKECEEDREFVVPLQDVAPFKHRIQTPLVRIIGTPQMRMDMVRLNGTTADIRFRAEFRKWEAVLRVRYHVGAISPAEIVNLINLAGNTVGIGEGRPEKGTDMTWGRWEVVTTKTPEPREVTPEEMPPKVAA